MLGQEDLVVVFFLQHLLEVPHADAQQLNVVHNDNLDADAAHELRLPEQLNHFHELLFEDDILRLHKAVYEASSAAARLVYWMQHQDNHVDVDLQVHHDLDRALRHYAGYLQQVNVTSNNDMHQENVSVTCHDVKHVQDVLRGQVL